MFSNFSKYGEAVKDLFKKVFNGNVILEPVDTAFQYAIKESEDKLKFPFISIYPNSNIILDKKNTSMPSYKEGLNIQKALKIYNDDGSYKGTNNRLAKNVKFLYIIIGYQIDIWATTRLEAEELIQELIFWLYENQQVVVNLDGVETVFTFDLANEIVDNSDLTTYTTNGKLYRYTTSINLRSILCRSENYFTALKSNIVVEELNN